MEFKVRISNTFMMNMFMIVLALGMAIFSFFYIRFEYEIFNYSYILWLTIAVVRLMNYRRYIYLILYNKPVLIANENYIYDVAKKIKYYWIDISEIYEDNAYLYIKLFKSIDYLSKIGGPVKRFATGVISNAHGTPFVINIDLVDVNANVFLEILDNYSVQAAAIENS
jgi:hypothetical protein